MKSFQRNGFSRSYQCGNARIFTLHYGKHWRQKKASEEIQYFSCITLPNSKGRNTGLKGNVHGEDIQRRGRPRKLSERNKQLLLRQIDVLRRQEGSFSVKRLMVEEGIDARTVSSKTVRRLLHRHGYKYIQAR